jgi:transposase
MKQKQPRRKFSKEFKGEAVALTAKRSVAEVAASLGLSESMLSRWKRAQATEREDAFRGNGNRTQLEEELRRLKQENAELREEAQILKKAAAYFAKHQK